MLVRAQHGFHAGHGAARPSAKPLAGLRAAPRPGGALNIGRPEPKEHEPQALGGGGGDEGGKSGGKSGGGGKGGFWGGWEDRVAFDPEFPFKVFLEQFIGVGACVLGDMSSRPNWGLNELDFVFSTVIVGSIMNFSLMYLLAPTAAAAGAGAAGGSLLQRALSEATLRGWGAPGGNMFEPGNFSAGMRLLNFGYKAGVFGAIGMLAGIFGTMTSNGLLALRKRLDPKFTTQNQPPNVLLNAVTWSLHMGLSSNIRYQILGGVDRLLAPAIPAAAFRLYSLVVRTSNNILGGISFVMTARLLGSQKAAAPAAAAGKAVPAKGKAAPAKPAAKKK